MKWGLSVLPPFQPSICLFICSGVFLELYHYFFLNFCVVLETNMKLCVTEPDFLEKTFLPLKLGKWTKNGPKIVCFFDLLKNLVINFYWICFIMKTYIVICVPVQIPYLGKILFLRYGPKCSQPMRFQDFLINHISRKNQWIKIAWVFACWYKFT